MAYLVETYMSEFVVLDHLAFLVRMLVLRSICFASLFSYQLKTKLEKQRVTIGDQRKSRRDMISHFSSKQSSNNIYN